ncbi:MAG TPA: hypothetical protein VM888_11605 [Chitinophagaceae bacterium]|jgi:hypothetical protein|nr:hypothetical protein [Chitinophagaceae bacterium]
MALVLLKVKDKIVEARMVKDSNLNIEGYMEGLKKDMLEHNEEGMDLKDVVWVIQFQT